MNCKVGIRLPSVRALVQLGCEFCTRQGKVQSNADNSAKNLTQHKTKFILITQIVPHRNFSILRFILFGMLICPMVIHAQNEGFDPPRNSSKTAVLPYNRQAKSAGRVVTYGDPHLENHTLDVAQIPGSPYVVVEDRYGIAVMDPEQAVLIDRWTFHSIDSLRPFMSTFSGIKAMLIGGKTYFIWGASTREEPPSGIMLAEWKDNKITPMRMINIPGIAPAANALPNDVAVWNENRNFYIYIVLNGNEQLVKMRFPDGKVEWTTQTGVAPFGIRIAGGKAFVTNWGGPQPLDPSRETAGVPWGKAYVDPRTGATAEGSVSVFDTQTGSKIAEIAVGLHPNAIINSPDYKALYVSNGNSDDISVIDVAANRETRRFPVGLFHTYGGLVGSTPNGLALDRKGETLYVSNGLDHAVAVVKLKPEPTIMGYIPTEAFPSGLTCLHDILAVTNLEAHGAGIKNQSAELRHSFDTLPETFKGAYNAHQQYASISFIKIPKTGKLRRYTKLVKKQAWVSRLKAHKALPRQGVPPVPVPERTGEPSVFKHVVYIIKENRTYDQVFGDMPEGRGKAELCIFGDSVTPNQHALARQFVLLDNYHASGKSSAEGHQWTDAGIVSDYVEKNVRAWFRSYPHRQYDAMVYTKEGFIWNHALDHGKRVRIYGEACDNEFDKNLSWSDIYKIYTSGSPFHFKNTTTISRVEPILSQTFPGYDDPKINDQLRADAFVKELNSYEAMAGDSLPELMIIALPNDHTAGTSPGFPTPRAQVADNDLALGKIIEALMKSRFWPNTAVFVTEDDSQNGWDHRSAYRTTAQVISPYSRRGKTVRTLYNQTSLLRTIELILGLPPMNTIDATALPMRDCFQSQPVWDSYTVLPNRIALDEMNPDLSMIEGKARYFAEKSLELYHEGIDNGADDLMNRILWFWAKGEEVYPK